MNGLLEEKNIREIYKKSKVIPLSNFNKFFPLAMGLIFFLILLANNTSIETSYTKINELVSFLFSAIFATLGFLVTGYTIFCTITPLDLQKKMIAHTDKKTGLLFFKKVHFIFVRVFIYFILFSFSLFIIYLFKDLNVNIAIILASFCCVILYWNTTPKKLNLIDDGVKRASMVIMNTAAVVGFGYVVKSTVGFQNLIDMLSNLGGNPLISFASATTLIAGATGSGSGGIGIAMEVFAQKYMDLGVNPEVLHRIAAIACNGLDTLPHNSMVITCLAACGMTHKESYKPIFITSVCITLIGLAFAVFLGIAFY